MTVFDITKDPDANLEYGLNWEPWLDGDTIASSTWAADQVGLTLSNSTHSTTKTTIWISGGVEGTVYIVTNHITTTSTPARQEDRSIRITVLDR